MRIVSIEGLVARCEAKGVARDANLFLVQDLALAPGDFVLVHVGYAIQKVDPVQVRSAWEAYDAVEAVERGAADA